MCTVGYLPNLGIIFKNRDKTVETIEELVQTPGLAAIQTKGADYYSSGINAHGCAFVSTAINTPKWTALASNGNHRDAAIQFTIENEGLSSPTKLISKYIVSARSARELVDFLKKSHWKFMGYNILLADQTEAYVVECYGDQRHIRKIHDCTAITNHFKYLSHGPLEFEHYPSSFKREREAQRRIEAVETIVDLKSLMCFTSPDDEDQSIWRVGNNFWTVSSSVLSFIHGTLEMSGSQTVKASL